MIFVTVGSSFFDELVEAMDTAIGENQIRTEVVIQIGYGGSYEPVHCEFFRSSPGLNAYYERASLVVGHGGTGTTLEILERGLRLISVSNPYVSDNHQHEFLEALERRGFLTYCRDLTTLPRLIEESLLKEPPSPVNLYHLFHTIIGDLDHLQPEQTKRFGIFRLFVNKLLHRLTPAKFLLKGRALQKEFHD